MAMSSLEPYGQRRSAAPRDAKGHDDERWHVRLTDDDVKLMTLEQLDDAYRLSIVDSETALWKPGMREWQPLRIVAGLEPGDDDDDEAVEVDVEPEITRVGPTPYDVTPHAPIQRLVPADNPFLRSSPPPARSTPPPPRLVSTHRPAPVAPAPRSVVVPPAPAPRSVAPVAVIPPAPRAVQAYPQQMAWNPVSVPPLALSVAPAPYVENSSGGFGRLLLAVAFLAGSAVSLYRNDVLLNWARAGHIENQFLSAEQKLLGGPAFGTVRAVATSATLWEPTPTSVPLTPVVAPEASKPTPAAAGEAPSTLPGARAGSALPERPVATAPTTKAAAEPTPRAESFAKPATPTATTTRPLQSRPTTTTVAKNAPPVRRAEKTTASPAPTLVRLDEEPQSDPRPPKSKREVASPDLPLPAGVGAKSTLDDAIRSAAARKTPKKKKPAGSEYDPLNPDL